MIELLKPEKLNSVRAEQPKDRSVDEPRPESEERDKSSRYELV